MPPRLFELRLQLIPVLCAVIFGTLDAPLGVRSSSAADVAAGPSSTADTAKKAEDLKALLAIANQLRNDLNDERNKLAGADKIVSQKGQVATPSSPEPPPLPSPAASVSAVVLSPAVQARVNEQFNNASQTLDFAQQALDRATKATDPTVMLVDLRDTMDKIRQARQFNERMRSVIDPPPVAVESVAPQTVSGTEVIIPSHEPLTYGSSTALAEAQQINLAQGADVRSQVFENWLRPVEPVKLDPATSVLTMDKGQTLTVEPLTTTLEQLPDTGIGTNFFQTVTTSEGAAVRFDPAVVQVVNDPQHQQELEQIGGVKLQVTLDLLSYYGVPEFRRRGPVTVVKAPVLVSLRNLLEQARSFADSSEHWQQLPTDLRYPGSIERVHGFVLDDQRSDVVLVGSPAASEQTRIDIDCLVVGLRAAWRDGTVPTVSLDPVHGRPAGPQYSRVENVPFDSVFARIMLEADYAMKRITFGELDVGVAGFGEINWTMALQRDLTASRFWLSPMPLGPGDLHVSPTYRTLLFESRVRCLTEAKTCAGQWSGQASANADQTAQLFTDVYPQLEASSLVEPAGIYRRMHGLVDLVTAGKILRDMRINYGTIREFVNLPVRVLSGEETTPRSYPGLDVAVGPPGINYRFRGGAMLESRLGRRSLDMYQDVTTMTLEQASNAFRTESKIAQQLDFSFCLPQSNDVSGSRIDLLMMKGWRAGGAEDYQTARDCFEAVTREDPFYAAAWSYLASAEAMLGHHDQAKAAMAEAVHLEPDDLSLLETEVFVLVKAHEAKVANVGELLAERQDEPAIRYLSMRMVDLSWSELDRNGPSEDIRKQVDFAIEGWRDNPFAWYVRSLTWGDDSDPNAADDRQMAIGLERKRVANGETGPEFLSLLLSIDVLARLNELRELVPGPFSAWKQDEKTVRDTLDVLEDILLEADEAELADVAQGLPVGLIAQAMAVRSTLRMQLGMPADVEAAIDAADRAVKEFPQVPDAHLARAMAIGAEGRWLASTPGADRQRLAGLQTELQRELDQAVALDRSYGPAYLMRAAMYAAFGPADKALEDLSEAKHWLPKLDPRLEQSIRNMIESQPAVPQPQPPTVPAGPQTQSTIALLDTIKQALRQYMDDRATYPESGIENLLKALGPEGTGTLALAAGQTDRLGRIVDGWGRPLVYKRTEEGGFRLYSVGPNGRDEDGGGDDVQLPDK